MRTFGFWTGTEISSTLLAEVLQAIEAGDWLRKYGRASEVSSEQWLVHWTNGGQHDGFTHVASEVDAVWMAVHLGYREIEQDNLWGGMGLNERLEKAQGPLQVAVVRLADGVLGRVLDAKGRLLFCTAALLSENEAQVQGDFWRARLEQNRRIEPAP